jgi:hypothetical protein
MATFTYEGLRHADPTRADYSRPMPPDEPPEYRDPDEFEPESDPEPPQAPADPRPGEERAHPPDDDEFREEEL